MYPKSDDQRKRLNDAVKNILLFKNVDPVSFYCEKLLLNQYLQYLAVWSEIFSSYCKYCSSRKYAYPFQRNYLAIPRGGVWKAKVFQFTFTCIKGYNATEVKDLFVQRNSWRESRRNGEIVPSPETNFMRTSIKYRGAIAWNSISSNESAANNLNQFKRLQSKFDIRKINFDPTAAVIKGAVSRGFCCFRSILC